MVLNLFFEFICVKLSSWYVHYNIDNFPYYFYSKFQENSILLIKIYPNIKMLDINNDN